MIKKIQNLYSASGLKPVDFLRFSLQGKIHAGYCPICESNVFFIQRSAWLRDNYFCLQCHSIPRQRAIVIALNLFSPNWRKSKIHESSPSGPSSEFISKNCPDYLATHFFPDVPPGEFKYGFRCENLEKMTFPDNSFDLIITQDVFEHVMNPALAFQEIHRVLKLGGAHIFTMPWYPKLTKTVQRATVVDGEVKFLEEPVYHGNPIDDKGSLVTYDWGIDFTDFIYTTGQMFTTIYLAKDRSMGLEAEFLEVFISRKV